MHLKKLCTVRRIYCVFFFDNKKTFKIVGECIFMFAVNKKERKKKISK